MLRNSGSTIINEAASVTLSLDSFLIGVNTLLRNSVGVEEGDGFIDEDELLSLGRSLLVVDTSFSGKLVRPCDIGGLPALPRDRLKALFSVKKQWKLKELEVYLAPVLPPSEKLTSFLMKLTRHQTISSDGSPFPLGEGIYSSLF